MPRAMSVAKELVGLAVAAGRPLSTVQLQKLLYLTQAWSLATRDSQLFPEPMEAWIAGPVVREVFDATKKAGGAVPGAGAFAGCGDLPAEDAGLVRAVWEQYGTYPGAELIDMTHADGPWRAARGDRPDRVRGDDPIPLDLVAEAYGGRDRPAPIAAYERSLAAADAAAEERLALVPRLDVARFKARVAPPPADWFDRELALDAAADAADEDDDDDDELADELAEFATPGGDDDE